ncbi:MAG: hypothetical protein QM831_40020 [Kofleriaceae bacterium]
MPTFIIRYRTHPERTDENMRLIRAVFADLREQPIPGLRYSASCTTDGAFTHIVTYDGETTALTKRPAFEQFQAGIRERCVEPPVRTEQTLVGSVG